MAETPRTRATLLTNFADNTAGGISPEELRDFVVTSMGCYGGIYVTSGATAQSSIGTSYVKMTEFTSNFSGADNVTPVGASSYIQIDYTGVYALSANLSFSGSSSTTFTVDFATNINGTPTAVTGAAAQRKLGSGGDVGSMTLISLVSLTAADEVGLVIKADGASKSITLTEASFGVWRFG